MDTDRSSQILELCENCARSIAPSEGVIQYGAASQGYRLRNNGFQFHELSHPELRAACIGLTRVLLYPGLNTIIDADHYHLWSWCAELFLGATAEDPQGLSYFSDEEYEIRKLFELTCRASIAGYTERQRGRGNAVSAQRALDVNSQEILRHSHALVAYLAFPLLEGILRKTCHSFVGLDGVVIAPFGVPGRNYGLGERCSSVRNMLWLLHSNVAQQELQSDLNAQRASLQRLDPARDPYDMVFAWRNASLHGEGMLTTIGGAVLNTIILIAIDSLRTNYADSRDRAVRHLQWQVGSRSRVDDHDPPWWFYPP